MKMIPYVATEIFHDPLENPDRAHLYKCTTLSMSYKGH